MVARKWAAALFVMIFFFHPWLATIDDPTAVSERKLSGAGAINSAPTPLLQNNACYPHVIFTIFTCPSPAYIPLCQYIENNTCHVWYSMDHVEFKALIAS